MDRERLVKLLEQNVEEVYPDELGYGRVKFKELTGQVASGPVTLVRYNPPGYDSAEKIHEMLIEVAARDIADNILYTLEYLKALGE